MEMIAPAVVKHIATSHLSRLATAAEVVKDRHPELAETLRAERHTLLIHMKQTQAFADRMKFASSMPWHPEGVMDWLIAQGWTPPSDLLLEPNQSDGGQ